MGDKGLIGADGKIEIQVRDLYRTIISNPAHDVGTHAATYLEYCRQYALTAA